MSNGRRANGVQKTTWPQPEEYYRYYAIENADWDAIEILIEGRSLKKPGVTEEALHWRRDRPSHGVHQLLRAFPLLQRRSSTALGPRRVTGRPEILNRPNT